MKGFSKDQRFILDQQLANHALEVLETLVKATYVKREAAGSCKSEGRPSSRGMEVSHTPMGFARTETEYDFIGEGVIGDRWKEKLKK